MKQWNYVARALLSVSFLLPIGAPSWASDGVLEINQTCAVETGCFAGDAPGFPVTITAMGSYKLSGNLDVRGEAAPEEVTAVEISAALVQLDLNGFGIVGPVLCSGAPPSCAPLGSGVGIRSTAEHTTVRNGSVSGMGGAGLDLDRHASVLDLAAIGNGGAGIRIAERSSVTGSRAVGNGGVGIEASVGARIHQNSASDNASFGLLLATGVGYAGNVLGGNNGGDFAPQINAPDTSVELSSNACGDTTCPVCGDAVCGSGEDCNTCALDCGVCPPPPTPPEVYTDDRTLSPITPHVLGTLQAIAANGPSLSDDVFSKVGSFETVSSNFLDCFSNGTIDLAGQTALQSTIDFFLGGDAGGVDPFIRNTLAANLGWSAQAVLMGSPSPLEQEVAATSPRFAVIHFGSNDIAFGAPAAFGENLLAIADQLIAAGVVPVFTSVPPRGDSASANAEVPLYNGLVRAVAQARQVPFIDYHREMAALPDLGLGVDGVFASVYRPGGTAAPCIFTSEGLTYGFNIRNLITLQTLDRLRLALIEGNGAPDASTTTIQGGGSSVDPFLVSSFPFSDVRDTTQSSESNIDSYSCAPGLDQSGPEYTYRLDVGSTTSIRATVVDEGSTDIDIHLLAGVPDGSACLQSGNDTLDANLSPGTYFLVLDTFVNGGIELAGEFVLSIIEN